VRQAIKVRELWERHRIALSIAICGCLVAIYYGFALRLPFFFDDMPVMTWVNHHSLVDIWTQHSEGAYYRPLTFSIYKLGLLFPFGVRQLLLHGVNLVVFWINGILIQSIVRMRGKSPSQALLASALYVTYPFLFMAVPWITAMPHHLASALTLVGAYAGLRAERDGKPGWWAIALAAILLAPFAHESGIVCSTIVGGLVILDNGIRPIRRRAFTIGSGILLSVGALLLRSHLPGVNTARLTGLDYWLQNAMFFLHGLVYPAAPAIGWLVRERGWQDFALITAATVAIVPVALWLTYRRRNWRYVAGCLGWWLCGSLPAALSFRYGHLYISPRLYALGAIGVAMAWAFGIVELGAAVGSKWGRRLIWAALTTAIVVQSSAFLFRQRSLFVTLNSVYQSVLEAADSEENVPLGLVNLPTSLAWPKKTHAVIHETVVFIPPYSDVEEFVGVNATPKKLHAVTYPPVLQAAKQIYGFAGEGIGWEEMRQFAIDHRSVWLTDYREGQVILRHVGSITPDSSPDTDDPLVCFEDGPIIESARADKIQDRQWKVTITWLASGPIDARIFVHVRDAEGNMVAQADGPALGGMVPTWVWQDGDRIYDVRYITIPEGTTGPHVVQVGVYTSEGRFPAFHGDTRYPEDAPTIASLTED
jgi:hypothetical protein